MTKKFKLTLDNYYSDERPHVSNSMMNDYLKSPAYYRDKYLGKNPDYKFKLTDPMRVGLAVDVWLTDSKKSFDKKFCRKFERTVKRFQRTVKKEDDPELFAKETALKVKQDEIYDKESEIIKKQIEDFGEEGVLSSAIYDKATQIASYVANQPFWAEGNDDAYYQLPLEGEVEGLLVCGLPDRIDPLGDTRYRLRDLKVVAAMKNSSAKKWMWNAIDMGYFRQLALYQHLWAEKQGVPLKNIECYHDVVSCIQPGVTKAAVYAVPQSILDAAFEEIKEIARLIKAEAFEDEPVTWDNVQQIGYENGDHKSPNAEWVTSYDEGDDEGSTES